MKGITLPSFLQIIQLDRKSCVLRIISQDRAGLLRFERGELLDAATGSLTGDEGAFEIACWDDAQIEIHPPRQGAQRTVKQSLTEILMEGIRRKDERIRDAPLPTSPPPHFGAAKGAMIAPKPAAPRPDPKTPRAVSCAWCSGAPPPDHP